jgi:hypothetical protein
MFYFVGPVMTPGSPKGPNANVDERSEHSLEITVITVIYGVRKKIPTYSSFICAEPISLSLDDEVSLPETKGIGAYQDESIHDYKFYSNLLNKKMDAGIFSRAWQQLANKLSEVFKLICWCCWRWP